MRTDLCTVCKQGVAIARPSRDQRRPAGYASTDPAPLTCALVRHSPSQLARVYYETYNQAPGGTGLTDALAVLEGRADSLDPTPVELRVAATVDRTIALNLGTPDGRCILVGPSGWRTAARSPVLFRRSPLTSPLPEPQDGGSLDELAELINVRFWDR